MKTEDQGPLEGEPVAWRYRYHPRGSWHLALSPEGDPKDSTCEVEPLYDRAITEGGDPLSSKPLVSSESIASGERPEAAAAELELIEEMRALVPLGYRQTITDAICNAWCGGFNECIDKHLPLPTSGWKLVPIEPTELMQCEAFEGDTLHNLVDAAFAWGGWPYSCRQSAEACSEIYRAMVSAAPLPESPPAASGLSATARSDESEIAPINYDWGQDFPELKRPDWKAKHDAAVRALIGCIEHMEHSTPQGATAWKEARTVIAATGPPLTSEPDQPKELGGGGVPEPLTALRELVACKDLKERREAMRVRFDGLIPLSHSEEYIEIVNEYEARQPLAWEAARRALGAVAPEKANPHVHLTESDSPAPGSVDGDRE